MTRPNEEPEPLTLRLARLASEMAKKGFHLVPRDPKGTKGFLGGRCRDCRLRVVKASGALINGRCGACNTAWQDREGLDGMPPAA